MCGGSSSSSSSSSNSRSSTIGYFVSVRSLWWLCHHTSLIDQIRCQRPQDHWDCHQKGDHWVQSVEEQQQGWKWKCEIFLKVLHREDERERIEWTWDSKVLMMVTSTLTWWCLEKMMAPPLHTVSLMMATSHTQWWQLIGVEPGQWASVIFHTKLSPIH